MNAQEIAQWVIENRYPKSENDKLSDLELFHEIKYKIELFLKSELEDIIDDCKGSFPEYHLGVIKSRLDFDLPL